MNDIAAAPRRAPGARYCVNGRAVSLRQLARGLGLSDGALHSWLHRARLAGIPNDEAPQWTADRCAANYRCDL